MKLSVGQKRKLRVSLSITASGLILGLIYAFLSDGFTSWFPFVNGAIIGSIVGLVISILELSVMGIRVRRRPFITVVLIRTLLYMVLIPLVIFFELITARVIRYGLSYKEVYFSKEFQNYLFNEDFSVVIFYTIGLSFLVNFASQISRKMGQGMLWGYVSGKYKKPRKGEKIILFMRISNSTEIINQLGSMKFLEFLNRVIYDITEPILLYKGIIYEYVEDECVVSWPMTNGLKNANCIHSVLELLNVINKNKEQYVNSYGYVPEINAALHCGPIIQAEVGSLKSDIAFYGDVMNVTSRILNKCPELGSQVLISEELFEQLPPSNLFKLKSKGEFKLKGKTDSIDLFSLAL